MDPQGIRRCHLWVCIFAYRLMLSPGLLEEQGQGHCEEGEIYSSPAWVLSPSSSGQRGFATLEYHSWCKEAVSRCINIETQATYVSVSMDAGFRCFTKSSCSPDGTTTAKSWKIGSANAASTAFARLGASTMGQTASWEQVDTDGQHCAQWYDIKVDGLDLAACQAACESNYAGTQCVGINFRASDAACSGCRDFDSFEGGGWIVYRRPSLPSASMDGSLRSSLQSSLVVPTTFELRVETQIGESVAVVGSESSLGKWDPVAGPRMSTDAELYPVWRSGQVQLSEGEVSFKFVIVQADGAVVWEDGEKRLITLVGPDDMYVFADWNTVAVTRRLTPTNALVPVSFEVQVETFWGDSVAVVGSVASLGNWNPALGLPMSTDASIYPIWRCDPVMLSEGEVFFRFVIIRTDGAVEWEDRENRRLTLAGTDLMHVVAIYGATTTITTTTVSNVTTSSTSVSSTTTSYTTSFSVTLSSNTSSTSASSTSTLSTSDSTSSTFSSTRSSISSYTTSSSLTSYSTTGTTRASSTLTFSSSSTSSTSPSARSSTSSFSGSSTTSGTAESSLFSYTSTGSTGAVSTHASNVTWVSMTTTALATASNTSTTHINTTHGHGTFIDTTSSTNVIIPNSTTYSITSSNAMTTTRTGSLTKPSNAFSNNIITSTTSTTIVNTTPVPIALPTPMPTPLPASAPMLAPIAVVPFPRWPPTPTPSPVSILQVIIGAQGEAVLGSRENICLNPATIPAFNRALALRTSVHVSQVSSNCTFVLDGRRLQDAAYTIRMNYSIEILVVQDEQSKTSSDLVASLQSIRDSDLQATVVNELARDHVNVAVALIFHALPAMVTIANATTKVVFDSIPVYVESTTTPTAAGPDVGQGASSGDTQDAAMQVVLVVIAVLIFLLLCFCLCKLCYNRVVSQDGQVSHKASADLRGSHKQMSARRDSGSSAQALHPEQEEIEDEEGTASDNRPSSPAKSVELLGSQPKDQEGKDDEGAASAPDVKIEEVEEWQNQDDEHCSNDNVIGPTPSTASLMRRISTLVVNWVSGARASPNHEEYRETRKSSSQEAPHSPLPGEVAPDDSSFPQFDEQLSGRNRSDSARGTNARSREHGSLFARMLSLGGSSRNLPHHHAASSDQREVEHADVGHQRSFNTGVTPVPPKRKRWDRA